MPRRAHLGAVDRVSEADDGEELDTEEAAWASGTERRVDTMRKIVAGVALWSAACLGIWLLTLSAISTGELVVGAACSLGVAVTAVAAWRAVGLRLAPKMSMLRPLLTLPVAIVADAAQVLALALRGRVRGSLWRVDTGARGPSPEAVTRRALATLGTTASPASMVLDVDDEGGMSIHALPTRGMHMEERFAKR